MFSLLYINFFLCSNIISHQYEHFPLFLHVHLHCFPYPTFSTNGFTYTLSSPHSCQTSHLVFSWRRLIHQYLQDTFWTSSHLLLSISLFPDHYGCCRTQTTHAQGIPSPLPLTFRRSQPTLFYTIPLIFLSTSQFHQHQTGPEKHTQLLHRLVSTGTYGNSYTQINRNTVQLFHLCRKTNFASCQLILWDGATTTTSLALTTLAGQWDINGIGWEYFRRGWLSLDRG